MAENLDFIFKSFNYCEWKEDCGNETSSKIMKTNMNCSG